MEGWISTHVRSHGEPSTGCYKHEWMNRAAMRGAMARSAARDASEFDRDNNGWSRCSRVGSADCDTLIILSKTRYSISSTTHREGAGLIAPAQGAQRRERKREKERSRQDDESPLMWNFVCHCIVINRQVRIHSMKNTECSIIGVFDEQKITRYKH